MRIVAVVLAAGESRRMGRLKALLPFGTGTVLGQVVQTLLRVGLDDVAVVLGHRAAEIATVLTTFPVQRLHNPGYQQGMTTSVQVALREITPVPDAYLLALVDQPQIGSGPIQEILAAWKRTRKGLVIPVYNGKRGHPLVLSSVYRQEVLSLGPQQGLNVVTRGHPDDTLEVPLATDDILRDMDYPAEYEAELQRWQARTEGTEGMKE